ncbi:ribokinase [Ignavibacteria bacterium 4148-Me]|uniref:ribokinase n=1 Tax=Rosettibacter primus TaxID=3111523 RepID=UPI00336C241E
MKRNKEIIVVGSTNTDLVSFVKKFPKPGETIFGKMFHIYPGGKGANQAVGLAKLGKNVVFISKVGNDDFGKKMLMNLKANRVNVKNIIIDNENPTGIAMITVDESGENYIVVISGANMNLSSEDIYKKQNLFSGAKIFLTQLEIPLETIDVCLSLSKINNMMTVLNPAPAKVLPEKILSLVDIITPNESELGILTNMEINSNSIEKAANILISKGVKNVVVTLGEKGAFLYNGKIAKYFPPYAIKALDTTAAGDAFNAGLVYALSEGYPLDDAIKFANATAAVSVTKYGAQTSMPTKEEVLNLL